MKCFDEKTLEDLLFEQISNKNDRFLVERGLDICTSGEWFRQVKLDSYGIADIIGFDLVRIGSMQILQVKIIELKVVNFDWRHIAQVRRYATAISHYILSIGDDIKEINIQYRNYVIMKKSELNSDESFFMNFNNGDNQSQTEIYSYDFSLEHGIKFEREDADLAKWYKTNFNPENTDLDKIRKIVLARSAKGTKDIILKEKLRNQHVLTQEDLNDEDF